MILSDEDRGGQKVGISTDMYTHGFGGGLYFDSMGKFLYTGATKVELSTGNRAFVCPYLTDVIEARHKFNGFPGRGVGSQILYLDESKQIAYYVTGHTIGAYELDSGNYNAVTWW